MGNELSYVGETGNGCLIYRETSGRYVVSHEQHPQHRRRVATLASAYATCHGLEMGLQGSSSRAGSLQHAAVGAALG